MLECEECLPGSKWAIRPFDLLPGLSLDPGERLSALDQSIDRFQLEIEFFRIGQKDRRYEALRLEPDQVEVEA